jgi:ATP-dependent DNA helicase RecG
MYKRGGLYDDRIEISNPGGLPKGLSREELGTRSVRRNPLIADLLHRIALIEKAGTGIRRMIEDARRYKCPEPKFTVNGFFTATFWPNVEIARRVTGQVTEQVTRQVTPQVALQATPQVIAILEAAQAALNREELQKAAGLRDREHFRKTYLQPLVIAGWLEMTIPEKPRSSKQRYRTTDLGHKILKQWREGK